LQKNEKDVSKNFPARKALHKSEILLFPVFKIIIGVNLLFKLEKFNAYRVAQEGQKLILSLTDLEKRVNQDPSHEGIVKVASPGSVGLKLYPKLIVEHQVDTGLGFTVLPSHAVGAFKECEKVKIHRLTNKVSETLYMGTHTNKFTSNRVITVMSEAEKCLKSI